MKTILLCCHTPSKNTLSLADNLHASAVRQVSMDNSEIQIVYKTPLETTSADILSADALILGTTENIGYMAGLTKDLFDRCYYDVIDKKQGMPYAIYIRAGLDGTVTAKALATINNGLRWHMVQPPLILKGEWKASFLDEVAELGMSMVAGMDMGIF